MLTLADLIAGKGAIAQITAPTISHKIEAIAHAQKALRVSDVVGESGEIETFDLGIECAYDADANLLHVAHDGTAEQ